MESLEPLTRSEDIIFDQVGHDPVSAADLAGQWNSRGPISRTLASLHKKGWLMRCWDGNSRFGRYLYFRHPGEPTPMVEVATSQGTMFVPTGK